MRGQSINVAPGSVGQFPEFNACDVCKSCARRDRNNPDHQFDDAQISCVSTHVFSYKSLAPAGTPTATSLPQALIKVTTQFLSGLGDMQQVTFDLGEGAKIVIPGCTARSTVDYPLVDGVDQPSIVVFWTMGAGDSKDAPNTARVTIDLGTIANTATSAAIRIPSFVDHATMENDAIAIPSVTLTQQDAAGVAVQVSAVGKLDDLGAPLASRATFFTLTNTGAAGAKFRVSWRLIF